MESPRFDSTGWTGELAPPRPLPLTVPQRRRPARDLSRNQLWAMGQSGLLLLSPMCLAAAAFTLSLATRDLLITAPALAPYGISAFLLGIGFLLAAYEGYWPRLLGWMAKAGWLAVLALAFCYLWAGLDAHVAPAGPAMRAQIAESHPRRRRLPLSVWALQDGSRVVTGDYRFHTTSRDRCFSVRRIVGRGGSRWPGIVAPDKFAWLRIVDASPLPRSGQLAWPIARTDCFTASDLSSLR